MNSNLIQILALVLQIGGFLPSLAILLTWHSAAAVLFALTFTVHLVGDVLFYLANRD